MSGYRFELAVPADDPQLRNVMRRTPMPGRLSVSFRREPSFFDANCVHGEFCQTIVCRDESGNIVGFGKRSIRDCYVNGQIEPIGYLSELRLLPEHRNLGLIARGYRFFRHLHADGRTPLYLTTIAADNAVALRMLTSGRAGLPTYHPAGRYHTLIFSTLPRRRRDQTFELRVAQPDDLPAMHHLIDQFGRTRQFFPVLRDEDLTSQSGTFRGLSWPNWLLAFRRTELVAILGVWDQSAFRQTVVERYSGPRGWLRPVHNLIAGMLRRPHWPYPGQPFGHQIAALPIAREGEQAAAEQLLAFSRTQNSSGDSIPLLAGFHESDPLRPIYERYAAMRYTTNLYLVSWTEGDAFRNKLDYRPPWLELGTL